MNGVSGLEAGDRVRVNGTETPYEGKTGQVKNMRDDFYCYGVKLDGLDGRRWFSKGELMPIKATAQPTMKKRGVG